MRSITTIWKRLRDAWGYRHEPERLRVLAGTYWRFLLFIAACIIVSVTLYGGTKFFAAHGNSGDSDFTPTGGGNILKPAELQAVLDGFVAREVQYESLKKNRPSIADPSR